MNDDDAQLTAPCAGAALLGVAGGGGAGAGGGGGRVPAARGVAQRLLRQEVGLLRGGDTVLSFISTVECIYVLHQSIQ